MAVTVPDRSQLRAEDTWDLTPLYPSWDSWDADLRRVQAELLPEIGKFKGRLGESMATLREALEWSDRWGMLLEKLGHYVSLRVAENLADQAALERQGRFESVMVQVSAGLAWWEPELLSLDEGIFLDWVDRPELKEWTVSLRKLWRYRPHTLSESEETLLALGSQADQVAAEAFEVLTNVDLKFGTLPTQDGERPLTQANFILFLQRPDRSLRLRAYDQFYAEFRDHAHTLAALLSGSVHRDVYYARSRRYPSCLERALFPDQVPVSVYETLIGVVRDSLPTLHRYYAIRRRALGLEKLHHADVYAPLVPGVQTRYRWEEAVDLIVEALQPLGEEYCSTLRHGLLEGRWCDRYESRGKRSGAFSSGAWEGPPYILMNYHEENLRDVFTLAHEAGHSMHSWFSARNNPFSCYRYTIFEAEVASTFNEQLLARFLLRSSPDRKLQAYVLSKQIEDFVATFFRQTMFAEFEWAIHRHAESGGGLTLEYFSQTYQGLLDAYFGPGMEFTSDSCLECLRIPHFYRAFYVYKYATGLAAAVALADRVAEGGAAEREAYLGFLKSGGSRYPLESLRLAGVDLATPEPLNAAVRHFSSALDRLEALLELNA